MKSILSNIFVVGYILGTLWLRLFLEPQLKGHFLVSVALGAFALLFLWALIKSKLVQPSIFNLSEKA